MYRNLKLTKNNIEIYHALSQKYSLIKNLSQKYFKENILDVGCGRMPYRKLLEEHNINYTGVDIANDVYQKENTPDYFWDGKTLPFENDIFQNAMLIEILEHVPDTKNILNEVYRILKKDGYLLITVPFLWNLHDIPHDEYRFTPYAIKRVLVESNFEIISIEAFGGWKASLASMIALFIKRSPLKKRNRKILLFFFYPIIKYLIKKDKYSDLSDFNKNSMFTGLWCLAKK